MDRLMALLCVLTASLLGLLVVAVATGAGTAAAQPHPDFAPMLQAPGEGRLGAPMWSGTFVGLVSIAMMWVTMRVGFRAGHWVYRAVDVWSVLYGVAFLLLMRSQAAYETGATTIVGGFTSGAAWLVYAIMLGPWILLFIYVYVFPVAYFSDDDQATFDRIVARAGQSE